LLDFLAEIGGLMSIFYPFFSYVFTFFYTPKMFLTSLVKSFGPITRASKVIDPKATKLALKLKDEDFYQLQEKDVITILTRLQ